MRKDVWRAGLLGGLVMFAWLIISNAIFPLKSNMIHRVVPNQFAVHNALKQNITTPGTYTCLYLDREEEAANPGYRDQPIYSITYEGTTHGTPASRADFMPIGLVFAATTLASWMLSVTSRRVRSTYMRRTLFVVLVGLVVVLYDDLLQISFGPQPRDYLVFLAANNLITWSLAGLTIAACVKPDAPDLSS